jgi:hypothetical protein
VINAINLTTKILSNCQFRKKEKMELLTVEDVKNLREFFNRPRPTISEEEKIKEVLTIRDFGVEISLEAAEAIRDYAYLKSRSVPKAFKEFMANEKEGGKIGLEQAKEIREYVEDSLRLRS